MNTQLHTRDARDTDADGLIALIGGVFAEYPGCVLDVDGELPELRAIASAFRRWNGQFWVIERNDEVVACGGLSPGHDGDGIELRKLYVRRDQRNAGLGSALCDRVERVARETHKTYVELWSDTRFETAHRLYEHRGYVRGAETRDLHDLSNSVEYYYRKSLDGRR